MCVWNCITSFSQSSSSKFENSWYSKLEFLKLVEIKSFCESIWYSILLIVVVRINFGTKWSKILFTRVMRELEFCHPLWLSAAVSFVSSLSFFKFCNYGIVNRWHFHFQTRKRVSRNDMINAVFWFTNSMQLPWWRKKKGTLLLHGTA